MKRESDTALYILLALYLFQETFGKAKALAANAVRELEQSGANLYEATHPSEAKHESDLPGPTLTREAVLAIAKKAAFPDPKLAAAIAMAESGGSSGAVARSSREYSVGLWQINVAAHHAYSAADMKDPIKNARAAFEISKGGTDWRPWSAYTNGRYRQFRTGILAP